MPQECDIRQYTGWSMLSQLQVSGVCNIPGSSISFRNLKGHPKENTTRDIRVKLVEQNMVIKELRTEEYIQHII